MATAGSPFFLGHKFLILCALSCFAWGGYSHWTSLESATERRLALEGQPPEIVEIDRFASTKSHAPAGEIRVKAQLDFTSTSLLEFAPISAGPRAFMVPLLPVDADGAIAPDPLGLVLFRGDRAAFDDAALEELLNGIIGMGAFGPIVELHGIVESQGLFYPLIYKALSEQGRALPSGALVMTTFDAPRAVALKPEPAGADLILFSGIGGVLMLLAVLLMAYRKGKTAKRIPAGAHFEIAPYAPEMVSGSATPSLLQEVIVPKIKPEEEADVYTPMSSAEPSRDLELRATTPFAEASHYMSGEAQPDPDEAFYMRKAAGGLFCTARLGPSIRDEIKLSKRAQAQLDADPFMQRLAQLG